MGDMTTNRITHYKSKATAHSCTVCNGTNEASKFGEVKECWNCDSTGVVHDEVTQARRDDKFVCELSSLRSGGFQIKVDLAVNTFFAQIQDHVKSVRHNVAREVFGYADALGENQESIDFTRVVFTKHGHDFDAIVADYIANS